VTEKLTDTTVEWVNFIRKLEAKELDIKLSAKEDDGERFNQIDRKLAEFSALFTHSFEATLQMDEFILEFLNNEFQRAKAVIALIQ